MNESTDRLALLERRTVELSRRVAELEGRLAPPLARPVAPPPPRRAPLEDLLGGRVLAWAGGVTVLAGIVLLFAVAVSRGWIGEGARTLAGALASFSLVVAGAWLHEARGRTDAARAATAAGIAGLFTVTVVATQLYELVPTGAGLAAALATSAVAVALAIRWNAQDLAALGIVGGLAAPLLVGAPQDGATTMLLAILASAAAVVCVARRWDWLALAAFAVTTPQWAVYALAAGTDTAQALFTLLGFGAIAGAAAIGSGSVVLLALSGVVVAGAGAVVFDHDVAWLTYLAGAHAIGGAILLRRDRELGVAALVLALGLADVALATLLSGPALAVAWLAVAALFAGLARWRGGEEVTGAALAHLALAVGHVLLVDSPPADGGTQALLSSLLALGGVGLVIAGLVEDRQVVRATGLALLAAVLAKVVLYDLGELTAMARVASFLGLGLLLLAGAFAWQRLRSDTVEDPVSE